MAADAGFSIIALCLAMYVLLDGYDLGIGELFLLEPDRRRRREMVEVVATAWDGNESWLILLGVGLWGWLPTAYGVMLPGLYLPVIIMLFALIFRGVAIELISAATGVPRGWGLAFGVGSLVTAFAQGMIIGALLSGVRMHNGEFSGGAFDFFNAYSVLTGLTTMLLYGLAGAAYLQLKTEGELHRWASAAGRVLLGFTAAFVTVCALSLPATATPLQLGVPARATVFGVATAVAATGFVLAWLGFGGSRDRKSMAGVVVAELAGLVALFVAIFPTVVPPDLTVAQAKAPVETLDFMLIGIGLNIPLVLFYNWYAHHVFRGKYQVPVEDRPDGVSPVSHALGSSQNAGTPPEGVGMP